MNKLFKSIKAKKYTKRVYPTSIIALGTTITYFFGKQFSKLKDRYMLTQDDGIIIYEIDHSNSESGVKEISYSEISENEKKNLLLTPNLKFSMKYFLTPLGYMQYLALKRNNEMLVTFCSSPKNINLIEEFMNSLRIKEVENNSLLNTIKI